MFFFFTYGNDGITKVANSCNSFSVNDRMSHMNDRFLNVHCDLEALYDGFSTSGGFTRKVFPI